MLLLALGTVCGAHTHFERCIETQETNSRTLNACIYLKHVSSDGSAQLDWVILANITFWLGTVHTRYQTHDFARLSGSVNQNVQNIYYTRCRCWSVVLGGTNQLVVAAWCHPCRHIREAARTSPPTSSLATAVSLTRGVGWGDRPWRFPSGLLAGQHDEGNFVAGHMSCCVPQLLPCYYGPFVEEGAGEHVAPSEPTVAGGRAARADNGW